MKPLVEGTHDIPRFDKTALIKALRTDQAGESAFPEFLAAMMSNTLKSIRPCR